MGKSENGPDMLDCAQYLIEIEKQHQCTTILLLDVVGSTAGCHWRVDVLSNQKGMVDPTMGWSVATNATYPHREFKTFEACVFRTLASHDAELARRHFQAMLDIT